MLKEDDLIERDKKALNTNFMPYSYVTLKDQQINLLVFQGILIFLNQMTFIHAYEFSVCTFLDINL